MRRPFLPLLNLALVALLATKGAGQAPPKVASPPPAQAATPGSAPALKVSAIEERLKALRAVKGTPQQVDLIKLYEQTAAFLREAESADARAKASDADRAQAPTVLKKLREELGRPAPPPPTVEARAATLTQAQEKLRLAEADAALARSELSKLEDESRRRTSRRVEIPTEVARFSQELKETDLALAALKPAKGETAETTAARRMMLRARKAALGAKIRATEQELASYDARGDLLKARQDQVKRRAKTAAVRTRLWGGVVAERRRREADRDASRARDADRAASHESPIVRKILEENRALAERRAGPEGLVARSETASKELAKVRALREKLDLDLKEIKARLNVTGLSSPVALLLRKRRAGLPRAQLLDQRIHARRAVMAGAQLALIELEEERARLADPEARADELLSQLRPPPPGDAAKDARNAVAKALTARRDLLNGLIKDYEAYFGVLVDLDTVERQLLAEADAFGDYIDENILWARSAEPLSLGLLPRAWDAGRWFCGGGNWRAALRALGLDAAHRTFSYALVGFLFLVLVIGRPWLKRGLVSLGADASSPKRASLFGTFRAILLTALIVAPLAALAAWIGGRLALAETSLFARALGRALGHVAALWLVIQVPRAVCLPGGLGDAHFGWRTETLTTLRRRLAWLAIVLPPLALVAWTLGAQPNDAWAESLGRLAFIATLLVEAVFIGLVFPPKGQVMRATLEHHPEGWLSRLRWVWYPLLTLVPFVLAVLSAAGYDYTARRLASRFELTVVLALAFTLGYATLQRWLLMVRRRLAIRRAGQIQKAKEAEVGDRASGAEGLTTVGEEDLRDIGLQTRRLLRGVTLLALLMALWWTWADVLPALGLLNRYKLWTTTVTAAAKPAEAGEAAPKAVEKVRAVTLSDLALAVVILLLTFTAGRNVPGLLRMTVFQRITRDAGVRFALGEVSRYLLTIVGVVWAFETIGVGWAKVQWLMAAGAVGLSFGLQEIFANFVSGLIILFERPIRLGDTVTVGGVTGTVTRIRIRATTITDWDRKELIVPNKEFVTGQIVNWTLSDSHVRMKFPVGIAYGSDTRLAHETLMRVGREAAHTLDDPPPQVVFKGFGSSSLDFELRVFIPGIEVFRTVWDEVNMAIDAAFRQADIEIAFPQQDLHVRSIEAALPIERVERAERQDERQVSGGGV